MVAKRFIYQAILFKVHSPRVRGSSPEKITPAVIGAVFNCKHAVSTTNKSCSSSSLVHFKNTLYYHTQKTSVNHTCVRHSLWPWIPRRLSCTGDFQHLSLKCWIHMATCPTSNRNIYLTAHDNTSYACLPALPAPEWMKGINTDVIWSSTAKLLGLSSSYPMFLCLVGLLLRQSAVNTMCFCTWKMHRSDSYVWRKTQVLLCTFPGLTVI